MELPSGVSALTELVREPPKSRAKRIFKKKKEDLLRDLDKSIEQAEGRYVHNNRASPTNPVMLTEDGKQTDTKLTKVSAAPNWRVQMNAKTKSNPHPSPVLVDSKDKGKADAAESVFIYLKAGRTKVPLMKSGNDRTTEMRLSSDDLVATLKFFRDQVEGWEQDNCLDAKIFHQVGVIDAIPPKAHADGLGGYAHCMEVDKVVEASAVKAGSPYKLDLKVEDRMPTDSTGLLINNED